MKLRNIALALLALLAVGIAGDLTYTTLPQTGDTDKVISNKIATSTASRIAARSVARDSPGSHSAVTSTRRDPGPAGVVPAGPGSVVMTIVPSGSAIRPSARRPG